MSQIEDINKIESYLNLKDEIDEIQNVTDIEGCMLIRSNDYSIVLSSIPIELQNDILWEIVVLRDTFQQFSSGIKNGDLLDLMLEGELGFIFLYSLPPNYILITFGPKTINLPFMKMGMFDIIYRVKSKIAIEDLRLKAIEEARIKAETEAKIKAEAEIARIKAEEEARIKTEIEARIKAEADAKMKAETESKMKAEADAKRKAETEAARKKAEEDARIKAEEIMKVELARIAAAALEEEARKKAEEEARIRAEAEAVRIKAEAEAARIRAEEEARIRAEAEAVRIKAEAEAARIRAEEEIRKKAEEEIRKKAEEEARIQAEAEAELTLKTGAKPAIIQLIDNFSTSPNKSLVLKEIFEKFILILDISNADELAEILDKIKDEVLVGIGSSLVLYDISRNARELRKITGQLSPKNISSLQKSINNWSERLNK